MVLPLELSEMKADGKVGVSTWSAALFFFFTVFYFYCVFCLSVGISTMYVLVPSGGKFRTLELELKMAVSYHMGA